MRYSLARYILSIVLPENFDASFVSAFGQSISIGGEGSYNNGISIELDESLWTTESDVTGSWVHNQNLSRTGKVTVTIKQVSDKISKFIRLCNCFYNLDTTTEQGLNMTLKDNEGNTISTMEDCYIEKIPKQEFVEKAGNQDWTFTCGRITMTPTT